MQIFDTGQVVQHLRFHPDGERLLIGTRTKDGVTSFSLWHPFTEEKTLLFTPIEPSDWFYRPGQVTITETHALFCCHKKCVIVRLESGEQVPPFGIEADEVIASPNGKTLITFETTNDKTALSNRDGVSGELRWSIAVNNWCDLIGFLPGEHVFVTSDLSGTHLRDTASGQTLNTAHFTGPARISNDGSILAVAGYETIYIYETETCTDPSGIRSLKQGQGYIDFALHPGTNDVALIDKSTTLIKIFDIESTKMKQKLNWKIGHLNSLDYSPNGALAAAGSVDGKVVVWDVEL